jgi:hypothetical protein
MEEISIITIEIEELSQKMMLSYDCWQARKGSIQSALSSQGNTKKII